MSNRHDTHFVIPGSLLAALISFTLVTASSFDRAFAIGPDDCGNGIVDTGEECDPPEDSACPGLCTTDCLCARPNLSAAIELFSIAGGGNTSMDDASIGDGYSITGTTAQLETGPSQKMTGDDPKLGQIQLSGGFWPLAVPSACCFQNGACSIQMPKICADLGGQPKPSNVNCDDNPCPQPEPRQACCFGNGNCIMRRVDRCVETGGTPQGTGSHCNQDPCIQPDPRGACCFGNGNCTVRMEQDCLALGGEPLASGTTCVNPGCPQLEACCLGNGNCLQRIEADCLDMGGDPQGQGTDCDKSGCP